jgi:hypothetical protein
VAGFEGALPVILVPAAPTEEAAQVAFDGFGDSEGNLALGVGKEGLDVLEESEGEPLERG